MKDLFRALRHAAFTAPQHPSVCTQRQPGTASCAPNIGASK